MQESEVLAKFIEDNLARGYIRESISPMAAKLFFVGKKDGTLRPVMDYRYLNEHTIKNAYPLPRIESLIEMTREWTTFVKFDVRDGYNNIRIRDGDQPKAAFVIPNELVGKAFYEPTVMFFGLCNSPATFQAFMDDIYNEMIKRNEAGVYMDDLISGG